MHSGRWGLSRETISLLYLRHIIIFPVGFSFVLSPNQYHNALQKAKKLKCDIVFFKPEYLFLCLLNFTTRDSYKKIILIKKYILMTSLQTASNYDNICDAISSYLHKGCVNWCQNIKHHFYFVWSMLTERKKKKKISYLI